MASAVAATLAEKARESGCVNKPVWLAGDTYRCSTESGAFSYFNVPGGTGERATPKAPTPAGFPRVDPETQKGRDGVRRKVLTEELATEEKSLAEARTAYADGAPVPLPGRACRRREVPRSHRAAAPVRRRAREEHRSAQEGAGRGQVTAPRGARATGGRENCCVAMASHAVAASAASPPPMTVISMPVAPFAGEDAASACAGLELLATAVLMLDSAHRVTYVNPAAENLFELAKKHLVGHRPDQIFADAQGLCAAIDKAEHGGATYTEQELELAIAGKAKLHLTCTVSPVDTRAAALLLEFRHIDQQLKIAREERLNEQQQANRELVRNLAHEIKNPLGGIRGAAQLLERELDRPQLIEYTQVVIGEADRLQALVNRLLTPHRLPSFRRTNIHEIVSRVRSVVQAEFPAVTHRLRFRHQPAGSRCRCGAAHAGDAQHRPQRGAGPRIDHRSIRRSA